MQVLEGTSSRDVRCAAVTNFLELFSLQHKPEPNVLDTFTEADESAFQKVSSSRSDPAHIRAGALFTRGLILSNMAQHQMRAYRLHEKAIATARAALESYTDAQKAERVLAQMPIIDGRLHHGYSHAADMLQMIVRMAQERLSIEDQIKADGMVAPMAEFLRTAQGHNWRMGDNIVGDNINAAASGSADVISSITNRQPGRQCDVCGVTSEHLTAQRKPSLRHCAVCKQTWYCTRECQRKGVRRPTA